MSLLSLQLFPNAVHIKPCVHITYLNINVLPATHTGRINNMREPHAARESKFDDTSRVVSLVEERSMSMEH
jgi:hypothetical protein